MTQSNLPNQGQSVWDTELRIAASTFTGSSQTIGTLTNVPVIMIITNDTNQTVFFADNTGSTKGKTMIAGERFVLDFRANNGLSAAFAFPIGTIFYATGAAGVGNTGSFYVSVIYAQ
jgi:hypothetical protein